MTVLLDKYLFYRPTYRLLADWRSHGLDLSLGTLTDGLKRMVPLLEPVYEALVKRSQGQRLWHADETRWLVFVMLEGKVGYRWYLWVFHSREVVIFILAAGRSHDVPEEHLGPVEGPGIMVVDRYKAYQAVDKVKSGLIVLAFCWAHVRRDFLATARSWPDQEAWAMGWVERIGELYRLNDQRLEVRDDAAAFATADGALRAAVTAFGARGEAELAAPDLHPAPRKVLESLGNHWTGLTVFVEHPEVPMDNNTAERSERGPVVGRKNYYGSGSLWSGRLAAMMFSLFQTLCLWGLNPRLWLTAYLEACAQAGGRAVEDVDRFLPWNLSPEQRRAWGCEDEVPAGHIIATSHGQVPTRNSNHRPHSQPGTRPGTGYALNGSRRVYRILTPKTAQMQEPSDHALGRSRGGFGTKIHLVCDSHGFIVAIHLTAGQTHESKVFEPTMARRLFLRRRGQSRWPRRVAADKGYSYPRIRQWCRRRRIEAVIPTRANQPQNKHFNKATYRQRHIVEQVVGWYKEYRALGTRYEKLAVNYVALWLVAIMDKALHRLFPNTA